MGCGKPATDTRPADPHGCGCCSAAKRTNSALERNRLLSRGQQRIVDKLVQLLAEAHTAGCYYCAASAGELMAELYLQADDERLALGQLTVDETSMNTPTR